MEVVILAGMAIIAKSLSDSKKTSEDPELKVKEVFTSVKNKYPIKDDKAGLEINVGDIPMPKRDTQMNFKDGVSNMNQNQDTWGANAYGNDLDHFEDQYEVLQHEPESMNRDGFSGVNGSGNMHNNMVPFFGSKKTQNTNSDLKERRLETFTGIDNVDFVKKKETANLFKPERQNIFGSMFNSNKDNYVVSDKMNNVSPIEKQYVGPGLGIGPNESAKGGFHDDFRILPDHLNSYKKETYKGRVVAGKSLNEGVQSKPNVSKHLPDRFYTMQDYEPMETSFFTDAPKIQNRQPNREGKATTNLNTHDDLTVFAGAAGGMGQAHMARENITQFRFDKSDENCGRLTSGPQAHESTGGGYNNSTFLVNESQREECGQALGAYKPVGRINNNNQAANMTIREGTSTCYNGVAKSYLPGSENQYATNNAQVYAKREDAHTVNHFNGAGRMNIRNDGNKLVVGEFKPDNNREIIKNPDILVKSAPDPDKMGEYQAGARINERFNSRFMPNLARDQLQDNKLINMPVKYSNQKTYLTTRA